MDPLHFERPNLDPAEVQRQKAEAKRKKAEKWQRRWHSPFTTAGKAFLLGLSPVGFYVPFQLFSAIGLCHGALGSGLSCKLPLVSGYFVALAGMLEVSCFFFGACLLWLLAAIAVWIAFIVYLLRGFYLLIRPA